MKTREPKVLIFDVETKYVKARIWRTGKQIVRHGQICKGEKFDIICVAYKWAHQKRVYCLDWGLHEQNSGPMIKKFGKIIEQADLVLGQNSDAFDIKQINTQRLIHGQTPIAWPLSEDLMKQVKRNFYVTSSSLDYMAKLLTGEGKSRMEEADWVDVVESKSKSALIKMKHYCKRDVIKTQAVWDKVRPYCKPKFDRRLLCGKDTCATCGSKNVAGHGQRVYLTKIVDRVRCNDCGSIRQFNSRLHSA